MFLGAPHRAAARQGDPKIKIFFFQVYRMLSEIINIDPEIWGPNFWHTIEAVCCTLIPDNKQAIYQFMIILKNVIPCEKCRLHYDLFLKKYPLIDYMQNSCTLLSWVYELKKEIKKRQGKEIEDFKSWINYLNERYDVPELLYYLYKNQELKAIVSESDNPAAKNIYKSFDQK